MCKSTGQPATSHWPLVSRPWAISPWTRRHHRPATGQMGITQEFSSQSITSHRPSSHRSLDLENINTGESQYSPVSGQLVMGHQTLYQPTFSELMPWAWFTNNTVKNSKRVLLPLEPDFSNMSDLSVVIEPPDNNWRSDNRQTSQTSFSRRRRDQSRSKRKSKKRRRRRSSSTSSSSRSTSSDSCKRSKKLKRSKHSHKKRRRSYTSSSSSSLSYNQSHDYGRYKEIDIVHTLHRIRVCYSLQK